ncbi:MAG: DUF4184 family protein [Chitinophagaceae bacterium]
MPFTFSHPAIVLPLNLLPKKWVSLTALVIGSLMPDLEAYLRFSSQKSQSHTWSALFWFCLPLGFLLSLLYHQLVRNAFIHHLPSFAYKRLVPYTHFNWLQHVKSNWPVVIISFLIGGASHLLWDLFSHFEGVLHRIDPALTGNTTVFGYNIEIPYLIQYLNSLLGLLVILLAIVFLPAQKEAIQKKRWWIYWLKIMLVTALVFGVRWMLLDTYKIDDIIVSFFTAFFIALLFISSIHYFKQKRATEI